MSCDRTALAARSECVAQTAAATIEVRLRGEIDLASVHLVHNLACLVDGRRHRTMRVDLREVTFLDARGIASFVELMHRGELSGCQVVFVNAHGVVAKVIELCGLNAFLLGSDSRQ